MNELNDIRLYYDKYKSALISEITDIKFLKWALSELKLSGSIRAAIKSRIIKLASDEQRDSD